MIDKPFGKTTVEIEKVIDSNSTKTFNVKSDLFYLDDDRGYTRVVSFKGTKLKIPNPLPVRNNSQEVIGAGALEVQNNVVVADIFLDYFTPERLTLETDSQKLWPHLVGYYTVIAHENRTIAVLFYVQAIDLMPHPTNDDRVLCLRP